MTAEEWAKLANGEVISLEENHNDPWIHRSKGMSCATCMWFVEKVATVEVERVVGRCRRHAPTMGGYPTVFFSDWCGDHKLDENKV